MNLDGTRDIFIVAGDRRQFDWLCDHAQEFWKDELRQKRVHYVAHARDLVLKKTARVFLYGTYEKRPDWDDIKLQIALNNHRALPIRGGV